MLFARGSSSQVGAFVSRSTWKGLPLCASSGMILLTAFKLARVMSMCGTGGLGMSAPAQVELVGQEAATSWLRITISEGKNRQIRRMLLAIGSQVIRLERISVGNVTVDDLEEGRQVLPDRATRQARPRAPKQAPALLLLPPAIHPSCPLLFFLPANSIQT